MMYFYCISTVFIFTKLRATLKIEQMKLLFLGKGASEKGIHKERQIQIYSGSNTIKYNIF